jgi:helix-turn-helix protein
MDALFNGLREISVILLPILGAMVLIFLLFLFYRLYFMMKKVDLLLDHVDRTMDVVDQELNELKNSIEVLSGVAKGVLYVQNFTKHSLMTATVFLAEHFDGIRQWFQEIFDKKSEPDVQTEADEEKAA